jgi:hypothetical protein
MSNYPLALFGQNYVYDYTVGSNMIYGGINATREVAPGIWAMAGGDGDSDGQITSGDKVEVWSIESGSSGYRQGDFSMNGNVDNTDKLEIWSPNAGLGCQVPQ